ncbi:phospholipase D-like domain-containing protein [Rugamonas sp. CCM 8940]|uniref:phospholipase D-like domain-containing protein n=2 Tax=Rugamonas sp. CCM 8940 TaxID=2765359 RepID=UPI003615C80D
MFKKIARDLKQAKHSVDIITWGFDPGMVLIRGGAAEIGQRYGDLLKEIAGRADHPVKVRLLVWHDDVFSQKQTNNNPSYYGTRFPSIGCTEENHYSEFHQSYNAEWYAQVCAGKIPNIHFHVRAVPTDFLEQSLQEETPPAGWKVDLAMRYASHHQKMVLIDYEMPERAIGYVMGHNSITDFWDTEEHRFRDIRRERFYSMDHVALQKAAWKEGQRFDSPYCAGYAPTEQERVFKERLVQSYIEKHSRVTKPYQDVSCRLHGPILYDLNHNFCQAWQESTYPSATFEKYYWLIKAASLVVPALLNEKIRDSVFKAKVDPNHAEMDSDFIARRNKIPLKAFNLASDRHSVQLLRTQPLHGEKAIKECYANLTRQTTHYMFIQNQYIQYQDWADHLIGCVGRLRSAGYLMPMYVFLLTSTPESDGMDRPTYSVASKVGMSETMRVEHEEAVAKARKNKIKPPISVAELADQGINVVMGSLWTCANIKGKLTPTDYEEIYIHAKVAIVDDAAFTIGSANLNLRSMALDSELNVLSQAKDVAYQLRADLFSQCTGNAGPAQFGDMFETFNNWEARQTDNDSLKKKGARLKCQLMPFHVDRKPGSPVV